MGSETVGGGGGGAKTKEETGHWELRWVVVGVWVRPGSYHRPPQASLLPTCLHGPHNLFSSYIIIELPTLFDLLGKRKKKMGTMSRFLSVTILIIVTLCDKQWSSASCEGSAGDGQAAVNFNQSVLDMWSWR